MEALTWQPRRLEGSERALVLFPRDQVKGLPVVYLLHGQFDEEADWMSQEKGGLATLLAKSCPVPMLIVLPFGGTEGKGEPSLQEFSRRLKRIKESIASMFAPDTSRRGNPRDFYGRKASACLRHEGASERWVLCCWNTQREVSRRQIKGIGSHYQLTAP